MTEPADHGGGIDAAAQRFGGTRADWLDLSTGINPTPYPLPAFCADDWTALPDHRATEAALTAARRFWRVPAGAAVLAAPGASSLIARIPLLAPARRVCIEGPTYNEHARSFAATGWSVVADGPAEATVRVHPNNPDGRLWPATALDGPGLCVIDESFCDVCPDASHIDRATRPGTVILKSFGKFWGLAGLRLGFAIAAPDLIGRLEAALGPWPVSGPALRLATLALSDRDWTAATRLRLAQDADRLDSLLQTAGARVCGGTALFRLVQVPDAQAWQAHLAGAQIWTRVFPWSQTHLRLGLPGQPADWDRLSRALQDIAA